jgi:hypothetical protein
MIVKRTRGDRRTRMFVPGWNEDPPPQSVTNFQHFQTRSHTNILQMMTDQVVVTTKKNFRKKFGVVKRSDGCENNLVVIWEK